MILKENMQSQLENGKIDLKQAITDEINLQKNVKKEYNQTILGTKEELFIALEKEDIYELQNIYQHGKPDKKGSGTGNKTRKYRKQTVFSCKICRFSSNFKLELLLHISRNHKDRASEMKLLPEEYMVAGEDPAVILYQCPNCSYLTPAKASFQCHILTHKELHELETYKCANCSFQSKQKCSVRDHIRAMHTPDYNINCPHCEFKTKHRKYIGRHIRLMHQVETLKMFRCNNCPFTTIYEKSLKMHRLTHKIGTRKMYKCPLCDFQTHLKMLLSKSSPHMKTKHKTFEEIRTFKCEICPYRAKIKSYVAKHMLTHQDRNEGIFFHCESCSFKTKHRNSLVLHMKTHTGTRPEDMLSCNVCSYKGRSYKHLQLHMIVHKSPEELPNYKCKLCSYNTCRSGNFNRHIADKHPDLQKVSSIKCELCSYQGKNKYRLRSHWNNVHKDPDKKRWKRCTLCSYKSCNGGNLQRHYITHKIYGNLKKLRCDKCSFTTYSIDSMKAHVFSHNTCKIKCEHCDYVTTYEPSFRQHIRKNHKE